MNHKLWIGAWVLLLITFVAFPAVGQRIPPKPTPTVSRDLKPKTAEKRLALVIGNADYRFATKLRNAGNDARDMSATLAKLGFTVLSGQDLTLAQMETKVLQFGEQLKAQKGVGLVYYAGHGIQFGGANYLIPIDAEIKSEQETKYKGLNLGLILDTLENAKNGFNLIVLDACRNNPFGRSWNRETSSVGGLAQTNAPNGTFIAYATAPGSIAEDGIGRNGTFTAELLKQIQIPNLKVEEVFKNVRQNVTAKTNNKQTPWDSSSLVGDFYFSGDGVSKLNTPTLVPEVQKTSDAEKNNGNVATIRSIPSFASIVTNYESNLIDDVIRDAKIFLEAEPDNSRINGLMGLSLFSKARITDAMPYLERSIALGDQVSLSTFRLKKQALINDDLKPGLISLSKNSISVQVGNDAFTGEYAQLKEIKFIETQSKDYALYVKGDFLYVEKDGEKSKQKNEKNKELILLAPQATAQQVSVAGVLRTVAFCKGCETWTKELVRLINRCRTGEIAMATESKMSVDRMIPDPKPGTDDRKVNLPSSDSYPFQSEKFLVSIPLNWRNLQGTDLAFAPENASGPKGITHGLMVLVIKPGSTNLNDAVMEQINSIIRMNAYLRQIDAKTLKLNGRPSIVSTMVGVSPATNKQENVNIASVLLKDRRLLSFVLVCPVDELPAYSEAFQKIVESIRIKD